MKNQRLRLACRSSRTYNEIVDGRIQKQGPRPSTETTYLTFGSHNLSHLTIS
jgi:hypothetical protein